MTSFAVPTSPTNWIFDFDPTTGPGVSATRYAWGIRTDVPSLWFHIGVQPTSWIRVGNGSGGSGTALQIFAYDVTGLEPDPSEITIALPSAMPSTSYGVVAQCQGVGRIVALDVPDAGKTTTSFLVIATGDLVATDRLLFIVGALTA